MTVIKINKNMDDTTILNLNKDIELDIISKTKIIINFIVEFEGVDPEDPDLLKELGPEGIYNCFYDSKTLLELLKQFKYWLEELIYVDAYANTIKTVKITDLIYLIRGLE